MESKELTWSKISQVFKIPEYLPPHGMVGSIPVFPGRIIHVQSANQSNNGVTDSIESDLLEIGKNAIKSNQIIGYFPLTITSSTANRNLGSRRLSLHLHPTSFPFLSAIFNIIIQIVFTCVWYIYFSMQLYSILHITRFTEKFAISTSAMLINYMIVGRRFYGLCFYRHTVEFWSQFLHELRQFHGAGQKGEILKSPVFHRIKLSIDKAVLRTFLVASLFGLHFAVTTIIKNYPNFQEDWTGPLVNIIVGTAWNVLGCVHVFIAAWTTFPLKILQGLLETLKEELDQQSHQKSCKLRDTWIQDYRRVSSLLKLYTLHFEKSLMIEIAYNSVQILCQTFSAFSWIIMSILLPAMSRCIPISFALRTIYQLSNEAGKVSQLHGQIYQRLCILEDDLDDEQMKRQVNSLLKEMMLDHLTVEPGRYFTLNRKLISSIWSTIITFVVVLVQFRDGETNKI